MKKSIFCIVLTLSIFPVLSAQNSSFHLQPDGTFLTIDKAKYIVQEFPNTSREELFNKLLVNISSLFISPQDVISSVPNEMISINAYADDIPFLTVPSAMGKVSFAPGTHYVIKIYVKDNKVRIDAPIITGIGKAGQVEFTYWMKQYKLYKKGEKNPKHLDVFDSFHNHFDNLIQNILRGNTAVEEDW